MSIKKYTNGSWTPASYRKYGTETDIITTLPVTIIGDGTPISSYTIKGNMEQNGTPTPSSPIYPSECGERTENLWDSELEQGSFNSLGQEFPSSARIRSDYIHIQNSDNYTITLTGAKGVAVYVYDANKNFLPSESTVEWQALPFTREIEAERHVRFVFAKKSSGSLDTIVPSDVSNIMLVKGSTAPTSYIPYGYKLPLTLGSTTTDIYLGEVQSTRRIKKLVLTGETAIYKNDSNSCLYYLINQPHKAIACVCSHLMSTVSYPTDEIGGVYLTDPSRPNTIYINLSRSVMEAQSSGNTVGGFKEYLAAQYAAGTPVTVWYVLAEPETAVVNEPIRKIGDYADSVSGTGLATSGAGQEFNINTTLKPSETDMTYHGWHEHEDTKYST